MREIRMLRAMQRVLETQLRKLNRARRRKRRIQTRSFLRINAPALDPTRYLIHDRDPLHTRESLSIVAASGIEAVKLPPRSGKFLPVTFTY
jgi:hypothetical protein